jgi:tetratricopeptide (TPR) repeat protein
MSAKEHYDNAVALHRQGRFADAEQYYRAALAGLPDHPETLYGLGLVCLKTGRLDEAAYRFSQVLAAVPAHHGALMGLGDALAADGRQEEAVPVFVRLIKTAPDNAGAWFALGQAQKQLGDFGAARESFTRAVALAPGNPSLHYALADCAPFGEGDARLAALEALARDESGFNERQKAELHFALFKAYDELGRLDDAFAHLERANRLYRATVAYDEARTFDFFRQIKETYTRETLVRLDGTGHPSAVPIFVTGMPRSGSTLVEQILASHPDVFGAGERLFVQDLILGGFAGKDYPRGLDGLGSEGLTRFGGYYAVRLSALAPSARRIVDKLPANFRHLGLLHLALPQARLIQVSRDARDTCFSCYTQLFANGLNYTYDLGELGHYAKAAGELMAHWRSVLPEGAVLDISYEALVADFETEVRRLLAFCGLTWDPAVLNFHQTRRAVRTRSEFQVRKPLYASSIGRWRRYEDRLGPLLAALV